MAIQHPPTYDELNDLRQQTKEAVDTAIHFLMRIDNLLAQIGDLLYVMQPFQSGRIAIDFNKHRGQTRPFIRVYHKVRAGKGKWTSTNVSHQRLTKRVKKAREFEPNYNLMLDLCGKISLLFELRAQMGERLRVLSWGVSKALEVREEGLDDLSTLISGMLDKVEVRFEGEMELDE